MAEEARVLVLGAQDLVCPVCLSRYARPCTLPCGHTFCHSCIEKHWDENECNCPVCQRSYRERPELSKNTDLSGLLEALQSPAHEHCPSCNGSGALRLCLPCGAPLCEDHVVLHQDGRHLLLNLPTAPWPCREHHRGLEYFCVPHGAPLCPTCALQHEECPPVPLLELYKTKRAKTEKKINHIEERIGGKENAIRSQKEAYREIQIVICDLKDNLSRDFREMREYLEKQERAALWRMRQEQDGAQREMSQMVQNLTAQLDDLKRRKMELQEQLENDWISLLKDVGSEETFTSPSVSWSPYTFENRIVDTTDAVTQMKRSLLSHVMLEDAPCPPKQVLEESLVLSSGSAQEGKDDARHPARAPSHLLQWGAVVSFDRNTVSCRLSLSPDLKTVTVADKNYAYPKNERRFSSCQALCSEGFSSGSVYWEVSAADSDGWGVGVAVAEIGKDQQLGEDDMSWCVKWKKDRLSAWHKSEEIGIPLPRPLVVGVLLHCTDKMVSFYSVTPDTEILIHTFRIHFQTKVFPAVWLFGLKKGKSLTIRDIRRTAA